MAMVFRENAREAAVIATVGTAVALAAVGQNHDALIIGSKKVSAARDVTSQ